MTIDAAVPAAITNWRTALPIGLLTAIVLAFGLFPEPVLQASQMAADSLADPTAYIRSVFPEETTP
jgi:multicomponent Na+:H+ antiporter subunit D